MADILPESSDWAFLPAHLLDSIAEKLVTSYQLLRFPRLFPSYQVAAIYNDFCLVALIKSGDKAWTSISIEQLELAADVIYYESRFHVLDRRLGLTKIKSFSGIERSIELGAIIKTPNRKYTSLESQISYLVESSSGELLTVVRILKEKDHEVQFVTWFFKVYKLNRSIRSHPVWVEIESIGGDALFLGDNHSVSLVASQFPGCLPNSIYYTDDFNDIVGSKASWAQRHGYL
ncbi:hypothetical protein RHGRI_008561 [Rhododendron griersonianum]|uniref:KIB1-4 beta-propeller domain-containing protein n=1 Tax=Rhododendron griersonianum TaxID=479676 RepID=A0AAV6L193_9ERIC|nr:hypothetical protein RHGRI_008561 [Rhododendron griersonianum]